MITVVRHPDFAKLVDETLLRKEMDHLVEVTTYGKKAKDSHAPGITNCVTAVRRVLQRSSNRALTLPPCWIGDMVRCLSLAYRWTVIETDSPRTGDLLFLGADYEKADRHKKRITHVMLWFNGFVFHSTNKGIGQFSDFPAGGKLEPFQVPHLVIRETVHDLITYIDPRNFRELAAVNDIALDRIRSLKGLPIRSLRLRVSRPLRPPIQRRNSITEQNSQ